MEWLRNYMIRKRDQATVSYSRFRTGEEEEDRPPPTQIMIAPFNEDDPQFKVVGYWHVERASVTLAAFGMCMVILLFISSFFEFNWYHHQRGVDISALLGLFTYLALGVLVHYYVLYGIKKQTAYYLLPFIVVYSVVLTGEAVALIGLIVKMVEPQDPIHPAYPPFSGMFLSLLIIVVVQVFMLSTVLRCRQYLSLKETHVLELKVAEKGKTQNPEMEIIIVGNGRINPSSATTTAANPSDVEAQHAPTPSDPVMSADNPLYGH